MPLAVTSRSDRRLGALLVAALGLAGAAGCDGGRATDPPPTPPAAQIAAVGWEYGVGEGLFLVDADGATSRRLPAPAPSGGFGQVVSWSPDGGRLAFSSPSLGGHVADVDGASVTQVTRAVTGVRLRRWDSQPAWAPDGRRLALTRLTTEFVGVEAPTRFIASEICLVGADGADQGCLALPVPAAHAAWSPDGRRLAFAGLAPGVPLPVPDPNTLCPTAIYVADADGAGVRAVTTVAAPTSCRGVSGDWSPAWSPDGRRLAFVSDRDRGASALPTTEVYVVAVDGGSPVRLTRTDFAQSPSWSPDGRRIAFAQRINGPGDLLSGVYVMNADGSDAVRVLRMGAEGVAWRPSR